MEFTTAELFLLQAVIGDNLKSLMNVRAENVRNESGCIYSWQFTLNSTLVKAIDHRVTELNDLLTRFVAESSDVAEADHSLAEADNEVEVEGALA